LRAGDDRGRFLTGAAALFVTFVLAGAFWFIQRVFGQL